MSRFSKSEAEAAGWVFVHRSEEERIVTSETQGASRVTPASYRAEKYLSLPGRPLVLINEEAETMGLLLERIFAFESQLEAKQAHDEPGVERDPQAFNEIPLDDAGLPQRTVILPGGDSITEEEWANRDKRDVLVVLNDEGEPEQVTVGGSLEAILASEAVSQVALDVENDRAAETDVGPTEQVDLDPADVAIDSPGQTGTGRIVVREDESSIAEVAERREAEKAEAESEKSLASPPKPGEEDVPEDVRVEEPSSEGEPMTDEERAEAEAAQDAREATDAARELAGAEGVELSGVEGSGLEGRVTKPDVQKEIADQPVDTPAQHPEAPPAEPEPDSEASDYAPPEPEPDKE